MKLERSDGPGLGVTLVIVHEPPVKKRAANAAAENAGLNYVRRITDQAHHIFRRVHEEDVGIDAHIELCRRPGEPSGFVVGLQVKAGESYIRNETETAFTFYPSIEDLQYWRSYALPIYLVVYHPAREVAYWLDIKKACDDKRFADMLAGISPRKLVFQKSNTFAGTFFQQVVPVGNLDQQRLYHTLLATLFEDDIDVSAPMLPIHLRQRIRKLDAPTAAKLLRFVDSKFPECVQKMMASGEREESLVEEYVREVAHELRERGYTAEGTGFVFMAFEDPAVRDKAAAGIEAIMPANRYLVLKARRCMGPVLMDHMLLVAFDDWETNEERFSTAWTPLKQSLGVALGGTYDIDFYGPNAAATFLTPDFAFQYEFEIFLDTGHDLELFDRCRLHARTPQEELDNEHLWITVGPDRVKAYYMWEQGIYWYLHAIRAVRNGDPWIGMYDYVLEREFEVEDEKGRDEFIRQAKAATCLAELPFMTDSIRDTINRGMEWGKGNDIPE
jgi:hypothetical protein